MVTVFISRFEVMSLTRLLSYVLYDIAQ